MSDINMLALLLICLIASPCFGVDWATQTLLDEYVHSDDGFYDYHVLEEHDQGDHKVFILNMTSQQWQNETLTTAPLWWHYLSIFVPKEPQIVDSAFLYIGGGNMRNDPPALDNSHMRRMAEFTRHTGAVSAYLMMVPNQPIFFVDDPSYRTEDWIIAYTWRLLIEDPAEDDEVDRTINLLFPMTKAAKRALDTIEEFVPTVHDELAPAQFMVSGYSKRGWTSWLLGGVDQRVTAIAPTVFDLLSMHDSLHHHFQSLGGWSWAFTPYRNENVAKYLNHPRFRFLEEDIDPFAYIERLTMPKMIIVAGNDQFFPATGSHYFYDSLIGPKFMCIWQNDDHTLGKHQDEIDLNLEAFFMATQSGFGFPDISWELSNYGGEGEEKASITLRGDQPIEVKGWVLNTTENVCEILRNNTCRRDTRFTAVTGSTGNIYEPAKVIDTGNEYVLELAQQVDGYRVFFMEMTYPGPGGREFRLSTEANVIPNNFPYPRCVTEEECHGRIV